MAVTLVSSAERKKFVVACGEKDGVLGQSHAVQMNLVDTTFPLCAHFAPYSSPFFLFNQAFKQTTGNRERTDRSQKGCRRLG